MKNGAERQQSARKREAVAPATEAAAGGTSARMRGPRCKQKKTRHLHDEALKQVTEAAQEIMRANVEKAKAGSLTHTRWLFSLMEVLQEEEQSSKGAERESLAEILIKQFGSKE